MVVGRKGGVGVWRSGGVDHWREERGVQIRRCGSLEGSEEV